MNKKDLVESVAAKAKMTKVDSKVAIDAVLDSIKEALLNGESVSLIGFGNFQIIERSERKGINPATKKQIVIPAKKVVKFKAGADLKK
ncbi:MAG: HU family DNA-binding protein [Paludibacteraceae bacterium]|nr:HU family DNA-binding protein [Paludibacteraceae bacterium]